jgi:hypothetical protein
MGPGCWLRQRLARNLGQPAANRSDASAYAPLWRVRLAGPSVGGYVNRGFALLYLDGRSAVIEQFEVDAAGWPSHIGHQQV